MSSNIESKIINIVEGNNLTGSKLDRLVDPKELLMNYLTTHISKINGTNELKTKIEDKLKAELDSGDLSVGAMLKVYEVLTRQEVDQSNGIVNLLSKALEVKKDYGDSKPNAANANGAANEETYTKEEVVTTKKFLGIIKKIEEGEFNFSEIKK
jgi:hypothetical protein